MMKKGISAFLISLLVLVLLPAPARAANVNNQDELLEALKNENDLVITIQDEFTITEDIKIRKHGITIMHGAKITIASGVIVTIVDDGNSFLVVIGELINNGTIINNRDLNVKNEAPLKYGELINNGFIQNNSGMSVFHGTSLNNNGLIENNSVIDNKGTLNNTGTLNNAGTITNEFGTINNLPGGRFTGNAPTGNPIVQHYNYSTLADPVTVTATHTLTDPTGVTVTGKMTASSRLIVRERVLHAEGACPACDEIRARMAAGELIVLYDISISGWYTGELEVSIPVGEQYNGQTVTILHCKNDVTESVTCVVQNGVAKGTFKKLSPFAVVRGAGVGVPEHVVVNPPKTGGRPIAPFGALLMACAVGMGVLVRKRRN